jgi:hypothetical protein
VACVEPSDRVIVPSLPVTPAPAVAGPVTGGQIWAQLPLQFDLVLVSGTNQYRVKPLALVSTVTPLICVVFKAEPEEAGLEDAPLVPPEPGDELPHAAASNAAATNTIAAGNLFRIDLSLHQQRPTRGTWAARAAASRIRWHTRPNPSVSPD